MHTHFFLFIFFFSNIFKCREIRELKKKNASLCACVFKKCKWDSSDRVVQSFKLIQISNKIDGREDDVNYEDIDCVNVNFSNKSSSDDE